MKLIMGVSTSRRCCRRVLICSNLATLCSLPNSASYILTLQLFVQASRLPDAAAGECSFAPTWQLFVLESQLPNSASYILTLQLFVHMIRLPMSSFFFPSEFFLSIGNCDISSGPVPCITFFLTSFFFCFFRFHSPFRPCPLIFFVKPSPPFFRTF